MNKTTDVVELIGALTTALAASKAAVSKATAAWDVWVFSEATARADVRAVEAAAWDVWVVAEAAARAAVRAAEAAANAVTMAAAAEAEDVQETDE